MFVLLLQPSKGGAWLVGGDSNKPTFLVFCPVALDRGQTGGLHAFGRDDCQAELLWYDWKKCPLTGGLLAPLHHLPDPSESTKVDK